MFKKRSVKEPSAPWITALKVSRLLGWLLALSLLANVGMGFAMTSLFPLKEKVPVFYEFRGNSDNFVVVEAADGELPANGRLISMFLRQYVADRETVDKQTETTIRYPRVMAMSGPQVAANFKAVYGNPSTGLYYKDGLKRSILVRRDTPLDYGLHQVEFETIDAQDGKPGENVNEWVATISYEFSDQLVSYDKSLLNPMGLFVTEYTLSRRKK